MRDQISSEQLERALDRMWPDVQTQARLVGHPLAESWHDEFQLTPPRQSGDVAVVFLGRSAYQAWTRLVLPRLADVFPAALRPWE